jgi:Zn-dependent M28 family amino/carboxypeptidase
MRGALLLLLCPALGAQPQISAERIRAHVRFLSSDLLEGRGVGQRGGDLASEYIAAQFALAGAKPAGEKGGYFQTVPLVGVQTLPGARIAAGNVELRWLDDFAGADRRQTPAADFEADAVFAGHGIVAPEFQWDDYKGADVAGKVVVVFTNEPPSADPAFFGGRALTYYGRWTYKYEQALRMGAAACLIVHTAPTAGYGWEVVRNSSGGENLAVDLAGLPALSFAGWITEDAAGRLFAQAGKTVPQLLAASESRDFRPVQLGFKIRVALQSRVRKIRSRNVAALVEGGDPAAASETVVFSAHWDHLGVASDGRGDRIYNGAVDNATGCGILLEIARAWAALKNKPRRSALFLAVTAEENGLLGSEYFAAHPPLSLKLVAGFNYDAVFPFGRTSDVVLNGAERTTLWPLAQSVAQRFGLEIQPDPRPEQGSYFRSDHFSFARSGVPAFSIRMGAQVVGKPAGFGADSFREYNTKHYHQPSDEYREDWDFSGLEQMAQFGLALAVDTANASKAPSFSTELAPSAPDTRSPGKIRISP